MVNPKSGKSVAGLAIRLSFGLSLLIIGINHYMNMETFVEMTSSDLGALTMLGTVWAYVLPALEIVGGALVAIGMFGSIAAWTAGLAIASIPVGMLLKSILSPVPLPDMMPIAHNTFIWVLVYYFAVKSMCCCCKGGSESSEQK